MEGYFIDELAIGQKASLSKTISESDIYTFAGITGDFNPAHVNQKYASDSFFGERIAHGILCAGLISAVFGTQLPGPGSIYLSQTLDFKAPVHIGDTITANVMVKKTDTEKNRVTFDTVCQNQEGVIVIAGEACLMPKRRN